MFHFLSSPAISVRPGLGTSPFSLSIHPHKHHTGNMTESLSSLPSIATTITMHSISDSNDDETCSISIQNIQNSSSTSNMSEVSQSSNSDATMNSITTDNPNHKVTSELWSKMTVPHLLRHCVEEDGTHTSYKLADKVDVHGNYLEFPNITIIHPIPFCRNPKLASLPLRLHQTVGVYLSPLPTYHATLLCGPLHAQLNGPCRPDDNLFAECLQEPCWERIAQYLEKKQFVPQNLKIRQVVVKRSGGLKVSLYQEEPAHRAETFRIRQELRQLGVCDGKLKKSLERLACQPNLGKKALQNIHHALNSLMEPTEREWHITLAYPRKSGGIMPKEVQEQVIQMVQDAFATDTTETTLQFLEPAQLCLSSDMTTFVPWNGKKRTFEINITLAQNTN